VSRLLAELVGAALRAARDTDGEFDPTVGALGARGWDAPDWLEGLGVPARLVGADRSVHVFGGWPT
jgi:thiamine biosynthesis lipoprotein ApbE